MKALTATLLFSLTSLALAYDNFKMCCLVNQQRANYGLPALGLEQRLTQAAQTQADYMAQIGVMGHTGPQNSQPGDRADWAGYNWQAIAENVAYGYPDEQSCMTNWMNSPGHRENILGDYKQFGSAVGYTGDGTPYYSQVFGSNGSNDNYPMCPSSYISGGGMSGASLGYGPSRSHSKNKSYAPSRGKYMPSHSRSNGGSRDYSPSYTSYSPSYGGNSYGDNNYSGSSNKNGWYTWYWTSGSNGNNWGGNNWNGNNWGGKSNGNNWGGKNNGNNWGGNNNGGSYGTTWTYY